MVIDVSGIDPMVLLEALYERAIPQGLGLLHARPSGGLPDDVRVTLRNDLDHAALEGRPVYFDWLIGRPMKVTIDGRTLDPWLYDRDNGAGVAADVVAALRAAALEVTAAG